MVADNGSERGPNAITDLPPGPVAPSRSARAADMAGRLLREIRYRLMRPAAIRLDGHVVPVGDVAMTPEIAAQLYGGHYEGPERRALRELIRADDRVLEVGTALGVVALAIRAAGPAAALHVEANPEMIEAAHATLAANGMEAEIRHGAVVPDDYDADTITLATGAAFWSGTTVAEAGKVLERQIEVPALRLGPLCAAFAPTVLVMDIEGAECALLDGGAALPDSVRAIVVELHVAKTGPAAQRRMLTALMEQSFWIDFRRSERENIVLFRQGV